MSEWASISGFSRYKVNERGEVLSSARKNKIVLKKKLSAYGYVVYNLIDDEGNRNMTYAHRLVASVFIGECPDGLQCAHLDGDKLNNHVSNLVWVTPKENNGHKFVHGTNMKPDKCGLAKLTDHQVTDIRNLRISKSLTYPQIANLYGVTKQTIYRIVNRKTWK